MPKAFINDPEAVQNALNAKSQLENRLTETANLKQPKDEETVDPEV